MEQKFLPIGSVVKRRDGEDYMITGYLLIMENDRNRLWDYSAVKFPVGYSDKQRITGLDQDEIETVICYGYMDIIQQKFMEALTEAKEALQKQVEVNAK